MESKKIINTKVRDIKIQIIFKNEKLITIAFLITKSLLLIIFYLLIL